MAWSSMGMAPRHQRRKIDVMRPVGRPEFFSPVAVSRRFVPGTSRMVGWSTTVAAVVLLGIVSSIARAQAPLRDNSPCPPEYTAFTNGVCTPPKSPPSGPTGSMIAGLDGTTTPWGKNLINRWQVPIGADPWSAHYEYGTPWPSGGGIWEIATPYGRGFRFVGTPEMTVPSGGKKSEMADIGNLVQGAGHLEAYSGMVMFPKAGNRWGFPRNYPNWNVFFDFHSNYGVPVQMGIDTTDVPRRNHIYLRLLPHTEKQRKARSRARLVYGRWYSWAIQVKWSSDSDGLLRWWLNGKLLADWTGPTLAISEIPYLQFGFYSAAQLHNEVLHAAMRKSPSLAGTTTTG